LIMWMAKGNFGACILAVVVSALALRSLHAQANLRLNVGRTNGNPVLTWRAQTLVPSPGQRLFAKYRILTSSNLVDWQAIGETMDGTNFANRDIRIEVDATDPRSFIKVESLLNFSGLNLIRRVLSNGNLEGGTFTGSDFFGATLNGCNLKDANLQAADFIAALLNEADLRGADLRGASFASASLIDADLRGANASFADFTSADLSGADFAGADLRFSSFLGAQADFIGLQNTLIDEETIFPRKTRLVWDIVNGKKVGARITNEVLSISNFRGADLRSTIWLGTDIRGSDLRDADLSGANLTGARLDFVDFRRTLITPSTILPEKWRLVWQLNNEDFSNAQLAGRDLSNASLVEARLKGANLTNANLQLSILLAANLEGANLQNARLREVIASEANFQNANLTRADLSLADLTDANLRGANITNAILTGAIFQNTTMPDGSIRN
jgi:uncharacterized protein YjbI with pentapeptide repeats